MMATYRRLLGRGFGLPAPTLVAKVGAPILGSGASLVLTGRRCVPSRLLAEGFEFRQTDFESAARRALDQLSPD
jgi:NAD dependent epimerase/dehydratase family enzyme